MARFQTAINSQLEGYDDGGGGSSGVRSGDEGYGDGGH